MYTLTLQDWVIQAGKTRITLKEAAVNNDGAMQQVIRNASTQQVYLIKFHE